MNATYTVKLYSSGEVIGTIMHSDALMSRGVMQPTRLGAIPHHLYDLAWEWQGTHEDTLVVAD